MATASVVFGKLKGIQPALGLGFVSEEVASAGTSAACPPAFNHCVVTAIGGNMWVALSTGTPDANTATARLPLTANIPVSFSVIPGTQVSVLDRT